MEMTWEELKQHAITEDLDLHRSQARAQQRTPNLFTVDQVPYALNIVRARLATRAGISPADQTLSALMYDREVLALAAEGSRGPVGQAIVLPDSSMIARLTEKDFAQACADHAVAYAVSSERGMERDEALELCLELHGALATDDEVVTFAKANGISLAPHRRKHRLTIAAMRARRDADGKFTPPDYPPTHERPDYAERVIDGVGGRQRADRDATSPDELMRAASRFADWLESPAAPRGALPTVAMWNLWSEGEVVEGRPRVWISATRKYPGGFAALIRDALDARLPPHQQEAEPSAEHLTRNGPVRGDESFDYDKPLVEYLRMSRHKHLLPILAYTSQHQPVLRAELREALNLTPVAQTRNVNRLMNLGALRPVPPLPEDTASVNERLTIGPAVEGEALEIVNGHAPIERAPKRATLIPQRARETANKRALEVIGEVIRPDGTFLGPAFCDALNKSRAAGYNRLAALEEDGLLLRESVPPEQRLTNEQYRFRLLPAADSASKAA